MKKSTKKISLDDYFVVDTTNIQTFDDIGVAFLTAKLSKSLSYQEAEILVGIILDIAFGDANLLYKDENGKYVRMSVQYTEPKKQKKPGFFTRIKNWFKKLFKREATR